MVASQNPRALWIVAATCFAVLGVRIGGVHVHLCFDGSEPAAAVHLLDGVDHAGDSGRGHDDEDIAGAGDVVTKANPAVGDLLLGPVLALAILFWIPTIRVRDPWLLERTTRVLTPFFILRPPLRGPPTASL